MENMNELNEMVLSPAEEAMMDVSTARVKGFLLGAAVVGAGVGLTYLVKRFRNRNVETEVIKPEEKGV